MSIECCGDGSGVQECNESFNFGMGDREQGMGRICLVWDDFRIFFLEVSDKRIVFVCASCRQFKILNQFNVSKELLIRNGGNDLRKELMSYEKNIDCHVSQWNVVHVWRWRWAQAPCVRYASLYGRGRVWPAVSSKIRTALIPDAFTTRHRPVLGVHLWTTCKNPGTYHETFQ